MIVRRPIGGDDEVAGRHQGLLALDGGVGPLPVEHEADRRGDVAMGRGDLAGQDHLDTGEQRVGGARFCRAEPGFSRISTRRLASSAADQAAGFHDQRFHVVVVPDHGRAARHRLVGDDRAHHLPQRRHVVAGDALVVGFAASSRGYASDRVRPSSGALRPRPTWHPPWNRSRDFAQGYTGRA